jgi:hypothetical protein
METNCQNCGSEMTLIPGGISKRTNKPYKSFMACPNKCKVNTNRSKPQLPDEIVQAINTIVQGVAKMHERMDGLAQYTKALSDTLKRFESDDKVVFYPKDAEKVENLKF